MKIKSTGSTGGVLRSARIASGISQSDLAKMLGIPASCLNRVELGKRAFDTDWMEQMPEPLREAVRVALARDVWALQRSSNDEGMSRDMS